MKTKLLIILVVFMSCYCTADVGQESEQNANWDYLVFTQQWPQTVCVSWKDKSSTHQCALPEKVESWTMHGIWPSDTSGKDPQFCNSTWTFNMTQLLPLLNGLETFWPNVYEGTSQDDFWKHEWTKHGTCASSDHLLDGEFEYFKRGLELVKKYDLNKALQAGNITPSVDQSYELKDIHAAVTAYLGTTSSISCYHHKKTDQFLIHEIRICLDKSLKVYECPEEVKQNLESDQFCPKDGIVYYLPIESTSPTTSNSTTKYEL